jgi:hypothetical protein
VTMRALIRTVSVALLGAAAALLVSCGSSGSGLIPSANAGPLQNDFEAVAQAAASGNGDCATTESALGKTEQDFLALPATIDRGLHLRLEQGISNLRKRALAMCVQLTPTATSTTSTQTTTTATTPSTTTETTPTDTQSTTTTTTPTSPETTPTSATPPSQSGGTEASGEGSGEHGAGATPPEGTGDGGSNAGGASAGSGQ